MFEQRIKIGEGGRLVIPAIFRKALHVDSGDELVISIQDGELRLFHQTQAMERIRKAVKLNKKGKSMTDEFLSFRKKDSE